MVVCDVIFSTLHAGKHCRNLYGLYASHSICSAQPEMAASKGGRQSGRWSGLRSRVCSYRRLESSGGVRRKQSDAEGKANGWVGKVCKVRMYIEGEGVRLCAEWAECWAVGRGLGPP